MNADQPESLRKELLDDFYAECDELVTTLRRSVTGMETAVRAGSPVEGPLEEAFRAMHSLKGICAIAGVRPAESLAHAVEDLLRALTLHELSFQPERLDLLLVAVEQLDQIVAAHRQNQPLPDAADVLARIAAQSPKSGPPLPPPAAPAPPVGRPDAAAGARRRGLHVWRAIFVPTPELDARGIRVNTIRERLRQLGEILSATPLVRPGGGLSFIFVLGLAGEPSDAAAWAADGLTLEPTAGGDKRSPVASEEVPVAEGAAALGLTPSHIVRVDLGRLDDLMRITGEIIIHRSRLEDRLGHRAENDDLKDIDLALARSLLELRAAVSRIRLVPVAEIFARMPYVLRDLTRGSPKQARMVLEGEQTEIDKYLVERLKEPLLHLVRNAFAHGVESAAERRAAGKPDEATLRLGAARVGDSVEIHVADDGRGIDTAAVAARAAALGLPVPAELDANALLELICRPGFSTREAADRTAGRGVGMAVVWNTVHELGGSLRLRQRPGGGAEFTLRLPLTLAIADALIVEVGAQVCALPQAQIEEIFQVAATDARFIQQSEVVPWRQALLPVTRLRTLFRFPPASAEGLTIVVVSSERGATGLVVDRVRSRREIVVRTLTDPLVRAPGLTGATELGDGRPVLVLDAVTLTAGVIRPHAAAAVAELVP